MRSKVFNTTFENMLRVLLLADTLNNSANVDRLAALDFICIYGKKCKVLDKNLHGDNEFGFAEFANKREKITEAVKLSESMASCTASMNAANKWCGVCNRPMLSYMSWGQRLYVDVFQAMQMKIYCNSSVTERQSQRRRKDA